MKNPYRKNIYAKVVENTRIKFSVSPYRTLWFSRKENLNSFEEALAVVLCNDVVGSIMNISTEILPIPYQTVTCFLSNGHKNTQTRCKACKPIKYTTTFDFRLGSDFYKP